MEFERDYSYDCVTNHQQKLHNNHRHPQKKKKTLQN